MSDIIPTVGDYAWINPFRVYDQVLVRDVPPKNQNVYTHIYTKMAIKYFYLDGATQYLKCTKYPPNGG